MSILERVPRSPSHCKYSSRRACRTIERVFFDYISGSRKKVGRDRSGQRNTEPPVDSGPDLSDLDLGAIELSEREMRALSGLTPALSRRLARSLLAHLPPAARPLARTLSARPAPATPPPAARPRASSADPAAPAAPAPCDAPVRSDSSPPEPSDKKQDLFDLQSFSEESASPSRSTLPRARRAPSRDLSPSPSEASGATPRRERPLLSKYLTPERAVSLDEPDASDGGSNVSETHSAPAGGAPLRPSSVDPVTADRPPRRVSRFLRSDFFESPPDEDPYSRHRREREMETQKILREIREKRNRAREAAAARPPLDPAPTTFSSRDDVSNLKKASSPLGLSPGKDRGRSTTPFFPILDNIKETAIDAGAAGSYSPRQKSLFDENSPRESRLIRPKSYPVKTMDSIDEPNEIPASDVSLDKDSDSKERLLSRESKLIRPKSYPASSPSPEKVYINRNDKKEDTPKTDIEVSFSITLPRKPKSDINKSASLRDKSTSDQSEESKLTNDSMITDSSLCIKKYQVVKDREIDKADATEINLDNGSTVQESVSNGKPDDIIKPTSNGDAKCKQSLSKKDEIVAKTKETDLGEKKATVKKKIIRKVSSKSKADLGSNQETSDSKTTPEKKKVVKKVKEKVADDESTKATTSKKKTVLQSIGQKLEKFASSKSNSPEKNTESNLTSNIKKEKPKMNRTEREQSVPANIQPTTDSKHIKRVATLTDLAAIDTQSTPQNKTTVSKVLGLFKKFEPKERKVIGEKPSSDNIKISTENNGKTKSEVEEHVDSLDIDKPCRPTSLLLNGLGRKNKYEKASSDSVTALSIDASNLSLPKKENEAKNLRNSLKLDFSRLPRVKKIVPTNPVIEPQIMNISLIDSETEKKNVADKTSSLLDTTNIENVDAQSRSRSRSRSTVSDIKSDLSADTKLTDRNPLSPSENSARHLRSRDSITPEKEDIVDRIRRKSFYSRFNEKKQRRKSSLVGPGASEYDPLARIHAPPTETKFDISPTSPSNYDLSPISPGLSVSSDLSPSTERYRSLLSDLPTSPRSNLRFDSYGLNDKVDIYRSLDRNDFRKYPTNRSYLEYDQPLSYGAQRYSRTKSLLDSSDGTEDNSLVNSLRDPHKYNRTLSMYSPGNYATYRPKRTLNSAIILKESEKEPSPENILEKIRQRKTISISVTRKPDSEKEPKPRSNISSKGEGDGAECSEKVD